MAEILLNDILKLDDLENVKIRLVMQANNFDFDPIRRFQENPKALLNDQYWNHNTKQYFNEGEITIGLVKIGTDRWLLFHVGKVTQDLNINNGVGYEWEILEEYQKYCGRVVVEYHNTAQCLVRNAGGFIQQCKVRQILDDVFDDDLFPGYENVRISWETLNRIKDKDAWKTALENQKGVYLITDKSNGKMYVGSAYGDNMLLGRWRAYINNGHGGNEGLKELVHKFDHIKQNFQYSILEIFQSKTADETIIKRETWWKETLHTRTFGYNKN